MLEIEVKFRIDCPEKVIEKLKEIGAKKVDSGFERNIKYDRDGQLSKAKELLRLRTYEGKSDITHKRPVPSERFKVREETVVRIDDYEKGKKLMEALGFEPSGRYEKKRQTWEWKGVGILVDLMPFLGNFIEIEGSEEKIAETAEELGLDMQDAIKKDYGELFEEYLKRHGLPGRDLVFPEGGE